MNQLGPDFQKKVLVRFPLVPVVMGAVFFVPAGTWHFWQAWVYSAITCIPMFLAVLYFMKKDPEFLKRRLPHQEKEKEQKIIFKLSSILYLCLFLLPGFDRRFGWSNVPFWLVVAADVIILLSYGLILLVFRQNRYASRVVEIMPGQKVIKTGPYSVVRHPMYIGVLAMLLFTPLALGSYWALICFILLVPIIVWRIRNEEQVLVAGLPGYVEYQQQVKYRLLPYLW